MAATLSPIWKKVGDAVLNKKCPFELEWIICWEKEEKNLESCFFVLILDYMEGGKEECLKILKKYISQPNNPLCIIF